MNFCSIALAWERAVAYGRPMHDDAIAAIIDGDHARAAFLLAELIAADPQDAQAHMLSGRLAADRRDFARELAMMHRAVELDPANGEYQALLGRCFQRAQDRDAALASVDRALRCTPLTDLAVDAVAATLVGLGQYRRAADVLERAASAGSRNAAIHFNLGCNLKFVGDLAGARRAFEAAIDLAPGYYKAHAALTSLGGVSTARNHLGRLESLIARTEDPGALIHLCHAASKECEALGRYDRSWQFLIKGKAAVRAVSPWRPDDAIPLLDAIPDAVERAGPRSAGVPGDPSRAPIFIVGMPRSGTTLLERIMTNHSGVGSIGESAYFAHLLKRRYGSTSPQMIDPAIVVAYADPDDLRELGTDYAAFATGLAEGASRVIDKLHVNFMLAGHIMRALPGARLLCLVRDPLDTVVSNFRQLFELSSPIYSYSLDLAATADFYVRFRRLAALWARIAPGQFMTVDYEALVAAPERAARRIFAFCGLAYEEGCERIEHNAAAVATASAVQVRQPIHRAAVGAWRHYEEHLGDVRAQLARSGFGT